MSPASGYESDAAILALKERLTRLELVVARNKPAAGIDFNDDGGDLGGGTINLADVIAALIAGGLTGYLRTTLGELHVIEDHSVSAPLGASETFDLANANVHLGELGEDVTITVVGWTNGKGCYTRLSLMGDGTSTPTVAGVTWLGSAPGVIGLGDVMHILLFSDDGGTTIWGSVLGGAAVATLDDLTDVTITTPVAADRLRYDGSVWRNSALFHHNVTAFDGTNWSVLFDGAGNPLYAEG